MNSGKIFERNFKQSAPDYALVYRLPDSAQAFGGNSTLRFSNKNPFDFLIWDSLRHILYAVEMKTVKGKSITFERAKGESKEIHLHQINGLNEWNRYDGIICGFVIEFREIATTIFLNIEDFNKLAAKITKKSFSIKDLDENGIHYSVIPQKLKRTRYTYQVNTLLEEAGKTIMEVKK